MIIINTKGFVNHKDYYELVRAFFSEYELKGLLEAEFEYEYGKFKSIIKKDLKTYEYVQDVGEYFEKESKNFFKREIYEALKNIFGKNLPWGSLTGIRPVKLVRDILAKTEIDAEKILIREYNLSKEKFELAKSISKLQDKTLKSLSDDSYSIYINIPFCPTICRFCSFPTFKYKESEANIYIENLIKEIELFSKLKNHQPTSIYIGGGTPSTLSPDLLNKLLKAITKNFGKGYEFTLEAGRADTIDIEKLSIMKAFGVNRISINPQTFNHESLEIIGRHQEDKLIFNAFEMARKIGFDTINADLITGLPKDDYKSFAKTLEKISQLRPENLTVHALSIKNGSQFYNYGVDENPDYDRIDFVAREFAQKKGYIPYYLYRQKRISGASENVGYALPDKECIYNIVMMEDTEDILAFGLGAVSKRIFNDGTIKRQPNFRNLKDYNERFLEIIAKKKLLFEMED